MPKIAVLVLCAWCNIALFAQSNFATLNGSVNDQQKRPVIAAKISLRSTLTDAVRATSVNDAGLFEIAGLAPGEYSLTVQATGFSALERTVVLEVGQQMRLDLTLSVGEKRESVDVVARAEVLKTSDASLGEVVETKSVEELPLNGRMLLDLAITVPGSHISHGAQAGDVNPLYWRPGQRSAISISGSRPNANYFLVDGVTNTDPTFNTQNIGLSPDMVQEFRVQTGSYAAELGGAGGGQINIVTRAGTSQFHGTMYEFLRNNAMDAVSFGEMSGNNHLVRNNFGASVGGPLVGKKTFFFANYEGLRLAQAMTMTDTVPTALEAAGDFTGSGANIFDPSSAHANPAFDPSKPVGPKNPKIIRDPFPGNTIPANRLNAASATFLKQYVPQPNMMGGIGMNMSSSMGLGIGGAMGTPSVFNAGTDANNYLDVRNMEHHQDQGSLRVDRVFDSGDSVFARFSMSSEAGFMPQNLPGFGAFHDNLSQNSNITWNRVISPNVLNTASIAMSRLAMHRYSENNYTRDIVSELGIQGVGFGGYGAYGAPFFNVQGYSALGDSFLATPMHAWDTIVEGRDTLSWQHGRHSLKFGASYRWFIWPMWGFFQNRGYYQFTNGFTTRTATGDGTGSALASYLLGLPAVRQRQAGIPSMDLRQWYADSFAQDTWRITPRTTIDFGLRYEFMSPLTDVKRQWSNLLVEDGRLKVFIGGQNGMPRGLLYPNKLRFAPRVGLAHQFGDSGFVWRMAYGIFYTPVDMNTWCNQLHNPPLVFAETNQSDNFIPSLDGFNFKPPVLGKTVVSYSTFDPHSPAQYIQQWSASLEKSLGHATVLEIGYLGDRGYHLQRAHLINNAPPGPGPVQPRRPYKTASFVDGTVFPPGITIASTTFPVSTVNLLENTARSWYDAGYVNIRRRYSHGLSLLANYTFGKNLTDAPDFRSPMFESSVAQNNNDLAAEKGPGCDIRHRFSLSAVYAIPAYRRSNLTRLATQNWQLSSIYQVQSGFPFTVSVFGDTANAGTVLGENPIRANYDGLPLYGAGTHTAQEWFNTAAFLTPPAYTFGDVGRNTLYGPSMQTMDLALVRQFTLTEKWRFQIRGEFFNALNHVNLGTPNRFVNTPQFGTITEAATPGREVQLSARLSF
ncbi:MAG TPA: carboxypeptidase regulatory-like domain-containing protein [Bryobacteraceae bacterium]|nr:carboxypeptidase regulatory-like domain-containing protein [Bryobacteraceae bacterium]